MIFPIADRVKYSKNPLVEVVCELKFPRLLKLETEVPSGFQTKIISEYPILETQHIVRFTVNAETQNQDKFRQYVFFSEHRDWQIILSSDSIALAATKYLQWEGLQTRLEHVLRAFLDEYKIPLFSRIGLRYRNVIDPLELALTIPVKWGDYITANVVGAIGDENLSHAKFMSKHDTFLMELESNDMLLAQYGLVQKDSPPTQGYLIDGDFYNEEQRKAEVADAIRIATRLHTEAHHFFRWCMTDELHRAMEPGPIS